MDEEGPVSVYIGGGTPSVWPVEELVALLNGMGVDSCEETTVEVNPGDGTEAWFSVLREAGVNRFSVGVQALDDGRLKQLGRRHDARQAAQAVEMAKRSGAKAVGADLIYGTPDHSPSDLERELEQFIALGVQHVSAYELTFAAGTRFGELVKRGILRPLADDALVRLWGVVKDTLGVAGFERYEVSNYAKPGYESGHNRHYWRGGAYIGLGAGGHGFVVLGDKTMYRYANGEDISGYMAAVARPVKATLFSGFGPGAAVERISALTHAREQVMLGLRTREGVLFSKILRGLESAVATRWMELAAELEQTGMVRRKREWLRPTELGMLHADGVAERFFG